MLPKSIKIVKSLVIWAKNNKIDIILTVGAVLISLLSFAMGYIIAKNYDKDPIEIEETVFLDINKTEIL
jgi:hypothetical protein